MKLIPLLFLILFKSSLERNAAIDSPLENNEKKKYPTYKNSLSLKTLKVDGFLGYGDSKVYTTNGYCVYLDKLEFDKDLDEIEVKVTVYGGVFEETKMYYLESNEEKKYNENIELKNYREYDREEEGSYSHATLYNKYTYYFLVPIPTTKYIYISIPEARFTQDGYLEISTKKGFPVWAIVLIVIGGIAILGFIIFLIKNRCSPDSNCCKDYCC